MPPGRTLFYVVEEWRILDAFYLNVTTLNTVGLGTLPQPTDTGRVFTVVYLFVGCVGLAFTSMKPAMVPRPSSCSGASPVSPTLGDFLDCLLVIYLRCDVIVLLMRWIGINGR
jgi:hypothetical protein